MRNFGDFFKKVLVGSKKSTHWIQASPKKDSVSDDPVRLTDEELQYFIKEFYKKEN